MTEKNKMRSTPRVPAAPSPAPQQGQTLHPQGFTLAKGFLSLLSHGRHLIPRKAVLKAVFAI